MRNRIGAGIIIGLCGALVLASAGVASWPYIAIGLAISAMMLVMLGLRHRR